MTIPKGFFHLSGVFETSFSPKVPLGMLPLYWVLPSQPKGIFWPMSVFTTLLGALAGLSVDQLVMGGGLSGRRWIEAVRSRFVLSLGRGAF